MSITQTPSNFVNFKSFSLKIKICACTLIHVFILSVNASELDARRAEILREVRETIQDDEMARQIVEIRLRREAKKLPDENVSAKKQAAYVGVGTRLVVGYSQKISQNLAVRTEASGLNSSEQIKAVDSSNYHFKEKNLSLGAYLDWFPTDASFRLSAGVNINRMRTTLNGNGSTVNINGSQVNLGSEVFNVEFKFPTITPYVGLGFGDRNDDSVGVHFYGDLGLMFGKYDAVATTSLVGIQGVKTSDVDAELNNLRKNLYKWSFIPTATVGLTYRFN
jgi:hypothetical protein